MSTQGLFIPLSVVQGDTLDIAFDVSLNGVLIDPDDITLEGQFIRNDMDDAFPETFNFVSADDSATIMHAIVDVETTQGLEVGEYTYQIRFEDKVNLSPSVDSTGYKKTILYGSLTVLSSPLFM